MNTHRAQIILVKIRTENAFSITLPVPIYVFTECLYACEGIMLILDKVLPRLMTIQAYNKVFGKDFGFYRLIETVLLIIEELQDYGKFDLVDVNAGKRKISIKLI